MLTQLYSYLSEANIDWAICGGHAIDLFIGRQTRDHKDIDVTVFWDQRDRVLAYLLQGPWRIFEPENGLLREVTGAQDDYRRNCNLWCIDPRSAAYQIEREHDNYFRITSECSRQDTLDFIEFLFDKRNGDQLVYRRNESIACRNAILRNGAGIPYLAPEMVLLYKSTFVRYGTSDLPADKALVADCRHDFMAALPLLNRERKAWLANALQIAYPGGHEWLAFLQCAFPLRPANLALLGRHPAKRLKRLCFTG